MTAASPGGAAGRPPYRAVRLCASGGGFEAIPHARVALDLASIAARLRSTGLPVLDARVMLIVATAPELTLGRDGRILVKTTDARRAEELVDELWTRIEGTASAPG